MSDVAQGMSDRVFAAVDAMKADAFVEFFAEDGRFVFGNNEPLLGHPAIAAGLEGFFATIQGLQHEPVHEWIVRSDTIVESRVTYTRLDGGTVTVPAVSIWQLGDDGLITDYRIFVDLAPLYAT
ncbi:nuclear transport factor 2 family protein [Flindersiella endophytica]